MSRRLLMNNKKVDVYKGIYEVDIVAPNTTLSFRDQANVEVNITPKINQIVTDKNWIIG